MYMLCTEGKGAAENIPVVNSTWITAVLDCLLTDWQCDFMRQYTDYEARDIEFKGDFSSGVNMGLGTSPPIYYVGVLTPYGAGGGQPVVVHKGMMYGR